MTDEGLRDKLLDVMEALWEEGSPVAGPGGRAALVDTALRRWRSFPRRNRLKAPTFEDRIEDLTRGLRDHLEADARLVGPLLDDYRHLARCMAQVLREHGGADGGGLAETGDGDTAGGPAVRGGDRSGDHGG